MYKEKGEVMSSFVIKIIAIICMTLDHYNDIIIGRFTFLQVLGRITFPLFCFQLVLGYSKTRSIPKYLLRLLIAALISQWPYMLFMDELNLPYSSNVVFTFLIGLLAICVYDIKCTFNGGRLSVSLRNKTIKTIDGISKTEYNISNIILNLEKLALISMLVLISNILKTDYKIWGVLLMLFIHVCYPFNEEINIGGYAKKIGKPANIALFLTGMFIFSFTKYIQNWSTHSVYNIFQLVTVTFLTSFIMLFYNGKKGPNMKYLFYIYYPAQFVLLVMLHRILQT